MSRETEGKETGKLKHWNDGEIEAGKLTMIEEITWVTRMEAVLMKE